MKLLGRNIITSFICKTFVVLQMIFLVSCDGLIYDDLDPCKEGLRLRFVYDYNMEFANAFHKQVDCLTLLVYDKDGNYIETRTEKAASLLSDENWRMTLDLPAGTYRLLAYGGMECDDASFAFADKPSAGSMTGDIEVNLNSGELTAPDGNDLHDLFYGYLEVTVPELAGNYTDATVEMMKDTNRIRIMLQHIDGSPIHYSDFGFSLTADNTRMGWDNRIIPVGATSYCPWARGQMTGGVDAVTGAAVEVAYAEFCTARLMASTDPRLEVTRVADGGTVMSIPLVSYLLMFKSDHFAAMKNQEYLDRENTWNVIFFLDRGNNWLRTEIVVNGWRVNINDIGM